MRRHLIINLSNTLICDITDCFMICLPSIFFVAIRGYDTTTLRWKEASDVSPEISAIIYSFRHLVLYKIT
jgi:hypothetical protein